MAICPKCQSELPCFRKLFNWNQYLSLNPNRVGLCRIYKCDSCGAQLRLTLGSQLCFIFTFIFIGLVALYFAIAKNVISLSTFSFLLMFVILFIPSYFIWWKNVAKLKPLEEFLTSKGKFSENFDKRSDSVNFNLIVKDIFQISGKGLLAKGLVEGGSIRVGDIVAVVTSSGVRKSGKVIGIEKERKNIKEALPGDEVGLLLSNFSKQDIYKGVVLKE